MTDDGQILQQFAQSAAQEPLAHLVARRVHFVYSSCQRQLRDPTFTDQATQATFVLLARAAGSLTNEGSLVPWLFDSAWRVCQLLAVHVGAPVEDGPSAVYTAPSDWSSLAPRMDAAIASLAPDDREAFLLKYVA